MGNGTSSAASDSDNGRSRGRVFFLLHRTWGIIVTDKWTKPRFPSRRSSRISGDDDASDLTSQCSYCSCSQCQRDDGFSSGFSSDIFYSGNSMSPNSDEGRRKESFQRQESMMKEKQRPPIYNPEDYALSLKKWGRRPPANGPGLYTNILGSEPEHVKLQGTNYRDYRNPMLLSAGSEMTLRQFGTVTELLAKLKNDLRLAYPSFVQEFVADPLDGVTLLLELLRAIQLSQVNSNSGTIGNATMKITPAMQRRALLDELACLQCLVCCCSRYSESIRKLSSTSGGLFTLAVCIMSNVNKSRILALQLLTKACDPTANGNAAVSEALSTLRLRFGEPVRFRFLVGMLTSAGGQGELLATGMRFVNTFLESAGSVQRRLYIQAELEQAGFDVISIKKNIAINSEYTEQIFNELDRWERGNVDAEALHSRLQMVEKDNESLRDKVLLLERRVQILLEEKGILISLEQCLKERCSELQDEVISLKSENTPRNSTTNLLSSKRDDSTPEDEGISSSERSITPEELQKEADSYEIYNTKNETYTSPDAVEEEEEEETTIEEVIEELRNIINEAETEDSEKVRMEQAQARSKIQMRVDECEIVPSNLHPQPPRRSRSLVHLYTSNGNYCNKEIFFENETVYSSDDSDSLLSEPKNDNRQILDSIMDAREKYEKRQRKVVEEVKVKSKSLDRIDDGLDAMVDIVVTETTKVYENPKMFLPNKLEKLDNSETRYYFPRVQEKRASVNGGFVIKRGHGNAGMYSENNILTKKPEFFTTTGSKNSSSKLTDFPSGLY